MASPLKMMAQLLCMAAALWMGGLAHATEYTLEQALEAAPSDELPNGVALTLADALKRAEQRSEALKAQHSAGLAAQQRATAAGELPDPMLNLEVSNIPANGPDQFSLAADFMTMRGIGVSQTFTRSDKRKAMAGVFQANVDMAQATRQQSLSELRTATAQAWFDAFYTKAMLQLLKAQQVELQLQIDASEALYRAGKAPQADVFMAKTELGLLALRIEDTQAAHAVAQSDLQRWVGGTRADYALAEPVNTRALSTSEQTLIAEVHRHPELRMLEQMEAMAKAEAEVKQQEKQADWTLSVMYAGRGPEFSEMLTLGASRPLFVNPGNRQNAEFAAATALADQARSERIERHRAHLAQTRRWVLNWESNIKRLGDFERSLIPLTQERTRAAMDAYRGATGSLGDVLAARRMELDMRMEQLRIEMTTAQLWAQLEFLIPEQEVQP